jgi:hypothetical protein
MKVFIKRILLIFCLYIASVVLILFVFGLIENKYLTWQGTGHETFIFGNSHTLSSVNPAIMETITGKKHYSYGANGQSFFWSLQGVEKRISHCPEATYMIEFTNNSITTDWWTYDNARMLRESDKKYQLQASEWAYLFRMNGLKTLKLFMTMPLPSTKIEGKFGKNTHDRLQEDIRLHAARILTQHRNLKENYEQDISFLNLQNIISNHPAAKFIILRSPLHHTYFEELKTTTNEPLYLRSIQKLASYPNCKVYDFGHLTMNDSCFADMDHLNYKGAKIFSGILADTLLKSE